MTDTLEQLILVDDDDQPVGTAEKLAAHRNGGRLHRAFSVMIYDSHQRMLLQQRRFDKYHSGGQWTNACCGHPRPSEETGAAAARRLYEEMGFRCPLTHVGTMQYRAELDNDLVEHELVHIFHGLYDGAVHPNPDECDGYTWTSQDDLAQWIASDPGRFTAWFLKYADADWPLHPRPG